MQKELMPLENPAAGILLSSQTKTHSSVLKEENQITSQNTQSDIKFVSNNTNTDKNLSLFNKNVVANTDNSPKTNTISDIENREVINEKMVQELNIEKVESETSNNDSNNPQNLMRNQTPEEQGVKAVIQGEIKYEEVSAKAVQQTQTQKPVLEVSASRIIDQITKQMNNINNGSKINIVLNPESLGKVVLQIVNTKEGLTAMFTVGNQDTRNLILNGLDGLKDNLLSQGIAVENITVKLTDSGDSEYSYDWTEQEESKGGNKEQQNKRHKDDSKRFEQMMFELNNQEKETA